MQQPSTHDLGHVLDKPTSQLLSRPPRISFFRVMNAIAQGERRLPAPAELPDALERRLHEVELQEPMRRLMRALAWVGSRLTLEGDETPRD